MNKKQLSERDICTKSITPALETAGWDVTTQIREELLLTKGRIIVRGKLHTRAKHKRADDALFYKPNIPIAIIEAKDNNHTVGDGMQQALGYADMLQVPFVFSSNGDCFLFHNKIALDGIVERELALHEFPTAETLWQWWVQHRGLNDQQNALVTQDYFSDGSDKSPRYYQLLAINKTIEAIARGQNRILLVMATSTGKTFTAFQIIWRLWKSKAKKHILFLADRNILVDQTMTNDFQPFGSAMTKIQRRQANKSYEIDLSLYKAWWGGAERKGRKTTEQAWKVSAKELIARNYNLDCKNPHEVEVNHREPEELMADYQQIVHQLEAAQAALKAELMACLGGMHER